MIGNYVFVIGGLLVRKDVFLYVKVVCELFFYVGINFIGLWRRGFDLKKISEI